LFAVFRLSRQRSALWWSAHERHLISDADPD
jgi:hypothetical protein